MSGDPGKDMNLIGISIFSVDYFKKNKANWNKIKCQQRSDGGDSGNVDKRE